MVALNTVTIRKIKIIDHLLSNLHIKEANKLTKKVNQPYKLENHVLT